MVKQIGTNGTESPNTMQWHTIRIRLSQPKEEKPWISIHGFNITFKADGTFTGSIQNGTIEGTWQADGKDRTVNINFTKTPPSTSYNNEFIEALNNAIFYQGDSNVLLLAPEGKKTYIQFAHNKQD
jgi:hypothetical protein